VVDGGSAVVAEDCGRIDGLAACVTVGRCGSSPSREGGGAKDLVGDVQGLHCVVATDAAGHEETLEEANDGGDTGPEEEEIKDAEAVATEIEVMGSKVAEYEGEEDAEDLVFAGAFVFGVEPGALLVVHVGGVDGVGRVHGVGPLEGMQGMIRGGENDSSN